MNQIQFPAWPHQLPLPTPRGRGGSSASPSCPCSQWAQNAEILPVNQGILFFFFLVTLLCPAHCPLGKVPAQLPVLLTQSLLCLLPHKYLQFKATVVPSTNRKGRSERVQCLQHMDQGALLPRHSQTHTRLRGGQGK